LFFISTEIEREELKVKSELKKQAKSGSKSACRTLAKSLVRARTHKNQMLETKAQLNSCTLQIKQAAGMYRLID
jgi:division protein CdvB (Snf7/Vps24/ESCRT-III family)